MDENPSPVLIAMDYYQSLSRYFNTDIYGEIKGDDEYIGFRIFKIVGWGTKNGKKYWRAANTYSANWGNLGFVYIDVE